MESRSRAWAELPPAYRDVTVLQVLDNRFVKYVMYEPVLRGFAEWEMWQNAPRPKIEAPDLPTNDVGVEAFLEGLEFGFGTSEP